jgi:hypothetical protein
MANLVKTTLDKTRVLVAGTNKTSRLTRQVICVNRCACFDRQIFFRKPITQLTFTHRPLISLFNEMSKFLLEQVDWPPVVNVIKRIFFFVIVPLVSAGCLSVVYLSALSNVCG